MSSTINVKRFLEGAWLPTRAHPTDAGLDLYTPESFTLWPGEFSVVDIGVGFELPEGTYGQILGRSSLAAGNDKFPGGVFPIGGVIDQAYRGSVKVTLVNVSKTPVHFSAGDKIAQLVIIHIERPQPVEVVELSDSDRGAKGFGSSGR